MTTTTTTYNEAAVCVQRAGTLYDVLDLILDRGMVIDVFVRVSLVGIEIIKIDARVVVASVDTYLRFAEVCNRLDLNEDPSTRTVPDLFLGAGRGTTSSLARSGAKKTARAVGGKIKEAVGAGDDESDGASPGKEEPKRAPRKRTPSASSTAARGSRTRARQARGRDE
jgi:gas vesicle structural protein